jgi:hypothetical protein
MVGGAAGDDEAGAEDAGATGDVDAGGVLPDELLPHAAATSPTPAIATAKARLWVRGKMSSMGRAGQGARGRPRRLDAAFVRSTGPYCRTP